MSDPPNCSIIRAHQDQILKNQDNTYNQAHNGSLLISQHRSSAISEDELSVQLSCPFFKTAPLEVRYKIYELVSELNSQVMDISMIPYTRGQPPIMAFNTAFPEAIKNLAPLLKIDNRQLQLEIQQFIGRQVTFTNCHSAGILDMPVVFGKAECALICRFGLRLEWAEKLWDERDRPDLLKPFYRDLPNLEYLKLYSSWFIKQDPYLENESRDPPKTLTRLDQEVRAKLKFMSFLVSRHPKLKLIIRPAEDGHVPIVNTILRIGHSLIAEMPQSGGRVWKSKEYVRAEPLDKEILDPQMKYPEDVSAWYGVRYWRRDDLRNDRFPTILHYEKHQKNVNITLEYLAPNKSEKVTVYDEIINASLVQRMKWNEFENMIKVYYMYHTRFWSVERRCHKLNCPRQ